MNQSASHRSAGPGRGRILTAQAASLCIAALFSSLAGAAAAADLGGATDPRAVDDPKLPRVLVIGDSISMNYHEPAQAALRGVANYHRIEGNAFSTMQGVTNMGRWLGNYQEKGQHWDVIQFNHGLHDLKQPYDAATGTWGAYAVPLKDYQANLEKEIALLKRTGAKLIWCTTTPVPNDNKGLYARRKGAEQEFNQAALEVMRRHPEIQVNDLCRLVNDSPVFDNWRKQSDVHFRPAEQTVLGEAVAQAVRKALEKPATNRLAQGGPSQRSNAPILFPGDRRSDSTQAPVYAAAAASVVAVIEPRCEYLQDPLGIDTPLPRFSWKLADPTHTRGQKQIAYQIVVRDGATGGANADLVLWDSGKVASPESVNNVYAGKKLTSGRNCHWTVRVWDKAGRPSAWSPEARFSVGLLDAWDWEGEWIRCREADNTKHIWYRKRFALDQVPALAFTYLCSIGYHEVYVNGQRIGTRVLSPEVTNLEKRALYVTYDITDKLRKGDNVIAVWTGPGWARADGSYGKGVWKQDSIFKCQVNLSNGVKLRSDASWKCKVSSSENLGLWKGGGQGEYGGELVDARRHIPDWNQTSCDDRDWANASIYQKSMILSAAMQEPDRKVEVLSPLSVTEKDGLYTFDMGRNFTGWIECDLRHGKAGEVVKFMTANRAGETLEFKQESQYIHDASGAGTFSHRFNYTAGRWISVAGLSYQPELKDLRCYVITNDRKRTGSFQCSNALFNRIYETDLRTYLSCTVNGVTMDCPHRERYGYGEVALACSWGCGIPNFESAPFYRKAARDWFDVQRPDGFVNTIAPQVYKGAGGTLWSSAPVTLSWEFYKAYGDRLLLEEAYQPMKQWLDFLHKSVSAEGVLTAYQSASRFLGDWATPHGSEYGNTPAAQLFNNCVYAYCLNVLVQSAEILGRAEDVKTYSARLADLRKNAHRHFFNEDSKTYVDGRQLAMAFPLYTGITPERERQAVFANLAKEISERKPYLDTGSSGLPILLKFIVEDAARADLLFPCLARTEYPGYGYFLACGETTWPEYWKVTGEPSRIHTCYTGIAGYFIKAIGGIRPDPAAYGMKKFLIQPNLVGDLTYANTTSGSLYGSMVCNWSRSGNTATFTLEMPVNTTAKVYIPAADGTDVLEGGQPAARADGVAGLGREGASAVFAVESGAYRFVSSHVVAGDK